MLALDPKVFDAVYAAVEAYLPEPPPDTHPLGCHRRRIPDKECFFGLVVRLVTGCSFDVAGRLSKVSETTLRRRRDEWVGSGVFSRLAEEALRAYDRICGLELDDLAIDGSQHKAPSGGEATGPNCTDKGRSGWKWSIATGRDGIPVGWVVAGANRNDCKLLAETLDEVASRGLLHDVDTVHLDRGYDFPFCRAELEARSLGYVIPKVRPRAGAKRVRKLKVKVALGPRWPVERTNSWLTNFGQLRRNTDRFAAHKLAALELSIAFVVTVKLVKHAKRWGG